MRIVAVWRDLGLFVVAGGVALVASELALAQEIKKTGYEEIVVTGERIERSLMETASSVAVFDDTYLSALAGDDRIEQVLDFVPNLQRGASDTGVAIRGQDTTGVLIGANAFLGGTRPRATLQIDGRVLNFNEFLYGLSSIWDVERIEVYRGPQTTTQGRNAIAGAIFIETKDPTFEFEGAARAIVGNYDTRQASLMVSGPLLEDQLAARVAVDWREHDSWMNYTAPDVFVGADREDDDYATARAKLLFTPTAVPDLAMMLTYTYLDASNPQGETADEPYKDRVQNIQNGAHWDTEVDSLVLVADYRLSDAWEARITGTVAESQSERFSPPGAGTAVVDADEYSMEGLLRFNPADSRLSALLGLSYFIADQDESSDLSAFLGFGEFTDTQHSAGVFGEATLIATDKLRLTVGGRWQKDKQERSGTLGPVGLDYDETFSEFLPKAEIAYDLSDNMVVGVTARKGFNPGGTTISFITGGVDEFDAETLWSYELFTRTVLAGGDLILSGNLFYTDFTDAQRSLITVVNLPGGGTAEFTEFDNAPSAESYGLEVDVLWRVNTALQVRASMGYLESEITETLLPNDPILGKEFQRAPRFTATLGLSIQPVESLTVDLNVRHNTSYYSDDANTPEFEIDGVTLVDAKATYRFDNLSVFGFVRNATDEDYQVWQFRSGNSSLGDPREYGLGVEYQF